MTTLSGLTMRSPVRALVPVLLLAAFGLTGIGMAVVMADSIPQKGNARLEALASAFGSLGTALIAVSVTLGAVIWTLRLEEHHRRHRDWHETQLVIARNAMAWLRRSRDLFGQLVGLRREATDATDDERREAKEREAAAVAQHYYDEGQGLTEAEEWARLTDDEQLAEVIRRADGQIRQWNEQVAGDDSSREVHLQFGDIWEVFGVVAECTEAAEERYIEMVRAERPSGA